MGWLKDIVKKVDEVQKDVIKKIQKGAEHAAEEIIDEVNKPIEEVIDEGKKFTEEKKRDLAAWTIDRFVEFLARKNPIFKLIAAVLKVYKREFLESL